MRAKTAKTTTHDHERNTTMNLKMLVLAIFTRKSAPETEAARLAGQRDGKAVADAYCDGLFGAASQRFQERLDAFHADRPQILLPAKRRPR